MSATMKLNADITTLTSAVSFRSRAYPRSRARSVSATIGHLAHERDYFSALRHPLAHERSKIRQTDPKSKLLANKQYLAKRSQWIFGGGGWGYDIHNSTLQ